VAPQLAILEERFMVHAQGVTLVLPAYNEVGGLRRAVEEAAYSLMKMDRGFEIIIAEDGSTDGTAEEARRIADSDPRVRCINSDKRLGRGRALTEAFRQSTGAILAYMDIDLSTETRFLEPLIDAVNEGYDIATGSRMIPESRVSRSLRRTIASHVYNGLVRLLLGSDIRDHQCGFKAFRRDGIFKVLERVQAGHWFWDTEVLVIANRMGLRIKEIPIVWREGEGTKVNLFRDLVEMGYQTFRLWWRLLKEGKDPR